MTDFQEDEFRNKSEADVIALLEGSSGMMIYWARLHAMLTTKNRLTNNWLKS